MKMLLDLSATTSRGKAAPRSLSVRLGALVLAILFTSAQMPAQGASAVSASNATQQNSSGKQSNSHVPAVNATALTDAALTAPDSTKTGTTALPDAPTIAAGSSESASLNMPPELKAMMDDANQVGQNLQSAPTTTKNKLVQRPGMLVLGIAGVPLIVLGAMIFSLNVGTNGKATGLRNGLGTAFLAPGAAMSGIGFYFAFHKKNR